MILTFLQLPLTCPHGRSLLETGKPRADTTIEILSTTISTVIEIDMLSYIGKPMLARCNFCWHSQQSDTDGVSYSCLQRLSSILELPKYSFFLLQLFAPPQIITRCDHGPRTLARSLSTLRRWLAFNRTFEPGEPSLNHHFLKYLSQPLYP
jgi:hypothetical protein